MQAHLPYLTKRGAAYYFRRHPRSPTLTETTDLSLTAMKQGERVASPAERSRVIQFRTSVRSIVKKD